MSELHSPILICHYNARMGLGQMELMQARRKYR